jgi:hypothetical protein
MSRVMMWLITAALFFVAWLFGPFSPLPFVSLLPLLLTSLAITSGRAARWVAGSVVLAVLVWGVGYFGLHDLFDPVLAVEFALCTLLYAVVPSPDGKKSGVTLMK